MEKVQPIPYRLPDGSGAFKVDVTLWVYDVKHRVRKRGFSTARAASQWGERELSRLRLGLPGETRRRRPAEPGDDPKTWTVAAVFEKCVDFWRASGRKRESTLVHNRATFKRTLAPLLGEKPFASLTARDVLHVLQLDQGLADPKASQLLAGMIRDAGRVGAVAPPVECIPPRPKSNPRLVFLTPEEIAKVRAVLCPSWRPAFLFCIATGVRVGELLGLQWSDVDLDNRTVTIRHSLVTAAAQYFWHPPKNGKARVLPLSDLAIQALQEQAALFPPVKNPENLDAGRVFRQTVVAFQAALRRAAKAAGVEKNTTPHVLRHTHASLQVQAGVQLQRVSALLGHSSLAMTMRYAHLRPDQLQESVDQLSEIVSAAL